VIGRIVLPLALLFWACGDGNRNLQDDGGSLPPPDGQQMDGGAERAGAMRYEWGDVIVNVVETPSTVTGLTLIVSDRAEPPVLDTTLQHPSASLPNITDGARVHALHTCADPSLYDIQVSTCAGINSTFLAPADVPGCQFQC
jgi:hypothetical protein